MTDPARSVERFGLHSSGSAAWRHPDGATSALLWSDDGRTVVGVGHTVVAWDVATGLARWTLRRPYTRVGALIDHGGRPSVFLGGATAEASVVDLETGAPGATLRNAPQIDCAAWHPRVGLAVVTRNVVRIYSPDLSSQRDLAAIGQGVIFGLEFSPDGRWLLASQMVSGAKRVDTARGDVSAGLEVDGARLARACFARGGASIIACGDGGAVFELDAERLTVRGTSPVGAPVFALCAPGCGERFVAHSGAGTLLRAKLGEPAEVFARGGQSHASGLAFSPDGTALAWAVGPRIVRLDASSAAPLDVFEGHVQPVVALATSTAQRAVVSLDDQGGLRAWSLPELRPIASAPDRNGAAARAFSHLPDRDAIALLEPGPAGQRVFDGAAGRFAREAWLGAGQRARWQVGEVSITLGPRALCVSRGGASFVAKVSPARVAMSPDGARVAWIDGNRVTILDTQAMQVTGTMKVKSLVGLALGTHPDRMLLIDTTRVTLVDTRAMRPLATHTPSGNLCWGVATSPALDAMVVSSGRDLALLAWDDLAPRCGPLALPDFAPSVALSADGATIVTGHANGLLRTWSLPPWRRDVAAQADAVNVAPAGSSPSRARGRRRAARG